MEQRPSRRAWAGYLLAGFVAGVLLVALVVAVLIISAISNSGVSLPGL